MGFVVHFALAASTDLGWSVWRSRKTPEQVGKACSRWRGSKKSAGMEGLFAVNVLQFQAGALGDGSSKVWLGQGRVSMSLLLAFRQI